jgi:pimeloyl-ACP methyl ester carboxylesterase
LRKIEMIAAIEPKHQPVGTPPFQGHHFANGVARDRAEVLYAVQQPTAASLFGERTTVAAWRSRPAWYAVSKLDETISPDLERFLAKRMKATTVELEAGHLSLVSHPQEIADLILAAARRATSQ